MARKLITNNIALILYISSLFNNSDPLIEKQLQIIFNFYIFKKDIFYRT